MISLRSFKSANQISYLIWDPHTRETIVVDPNVDSMMDYREQISELGLRVKVAVDLRLHAEHFSATHLFQDFSASIAMSAHTRSPRRTLALAEGDTLNLGSQSLRILETPGRSSDAIALVTDSMVFTGDVLLIGTVGHASEPDSNPEILWKSLQKLLRLDPKTLVFPGQDHTDLIASSIDAEKRNNPSLQMSPEDFIASEKENYRPTWNEDAQVFRDFNLREHPETPPPHSNPRGENRIQCPDEARPTSITVEKFQHKLSSPQCAFIDVREPAEFLEGHIPGTKNIPLARIPFELEALKAYSRVYVSCLSGKRSERAAKTLSYLGLPDVVNVSGGFKAWSNAEFPVEK